MSSKVVAVDVIAPTSSKWCGRTWLWIAALFALVVCVLVWGGISAERWDRFGVLALDPLFADTAAVLAAGEADARGLDPYMGGNKIDPYGRPHVYGPWWLEIGRLGLGVRHTEWVGWATVLLFMVCLGRLFRPTRALDFALLCALVLSPPLMLAINRANNDIVILALTLLAGWLAVREAKLAPVASLAIAGLNMLLKFYPVAQFLAVFAMPGANFKRLRRRACWLGLAVAVAGCLQAEAYFKAQSLAPNYLTIHGYGLNVLFTVLGIMWNHMPWTQWWGGMVGVLAGFAFLFSGRRGWAGFLPETGAWAFVTVASASTWIACLLAGTSFSYRAVWLLPLLALAWRRRADADYPWSVLVVLMLWVCWPKEYASRQIEQGLAGQSLAINVATIEQCLMFATWIACVWMLTGWVRRRLATWRAER